MSDSDSGLTIPKEFPFPFEPYDIQKSFMSKLYACLSTGKIGIFESPTGTGKSLSLICGALKWLRDLQEQQKKELESLLDNGSSKGNKNDNTTAEVDWISEFVQKKEKEEKLEKIKQEQEQIKKNEDRVKSFRKKKIRGGKRKRSKLDDDFDDLMTTASSDIKKAFEAEMNEIENGDFSSDFENKDDELLLLDCESDEENKECRSEDENGGEEHITKIYYCSRTHSQLSQFVREVIKSPYGDDTRVVSLGSRQNLCVNDAVRRLRSLNLMNDMCLDMQKNKKSVRDKDGESAAKRKNKGGGCPYYKREAIEDFKDNMLMDILDMEEIVKTGKQMKACPYYGTRFSIPAAELVVLPYNTLLHKGTREACGIKLEGNVVIVDEAHNLLETINNIHTVEVTGAQILRAHSQLTQYENSILSNLIKFFGGKTEMSGDKQFIGKPETKLWSVNNFLFQSKLDNINLFEVLNYCQKSQVSRKLHGFAEKYQQTEVDIKPEKEKAHSGVSNFLKEITQKNENQNVNSDVNTTKFSEDGTVLRSPMMLIESFLAALTNANKDGRIVVSKQALLSQSSLKFLMMNPAVHFTDIVKDARSVIVAGGTMQPLDEFKDQLFHASGVTPEQIVEYSCGHVIPSDHLLAMSLATGPSGVEFDFTYQTRENSKLLNELGLLLSNICQAVPGGVVCFFPSYDYQRIVYSHWEKSGTLLRIGHKKRVFQEPKKASEVDHVLAEYSSCIQRSRALSVGSLTGAILFCVVGGKMSEGINFSDELGRCVVMVGMPYPNIKSPELQEKMEYLNANFKVAEDGRKPGQVHYENLCMKAVNQSIGRAIRHRGDYASIILLDKRYGKPNVASKLPSWISKDLQKMEKYSSAVAVISKFFASKK
ncbi:hypothetical protein KUTeg_008478 [Tegillarca granosa]|uniref:Helicase ATP-binding domain-containing protein n=1 Tax=Tegillarca granosa TaxID=220873 RepID=A0ABQ9FDI0_TEGGR|nr:hypothetical protein KUTeg_008478 [Tegillarca granosa]